MFALNRVVRFLILTSVVAALALVSLAVGHAIRPESADAAGGTQAPSMGLWPIFHFDPWRDGVNSNVQTISTSNVGQLKLLWSATLPATADSTAVYANRQLYFTLKDGSLVALNVTSGAQLWRDTTVGPNYTTSSPALDV
jgi:outer membrane protein assembly factor BamB